MLLVLALALVALALFAAGIFPRITYVVAMLALTVRALVILQYRSAHDIGLAARRAPGTRDRPVGRRHDGLAAWRCAIEEHN